MKKLQKAISLTLAAALMCGLLCVSASAARGPDSPLFGVLGVNYSEETSREIVKSGSSSLYLVTVKVGTSLGFYDPNWSYLSEARVEANGNYATVRNGKTLDSEHATKLDDEGRIVLTENEIGLWYNYGGDWFDSHYLLVIPDDGTSTTQPGTPVQPEKPTASTTVTSTYHETYGSEDGYEEPWGEWMSLKLELDREPVAVELPWSSEGYIPTIYVAPGTKVLSGSYAEGYNGALENIEGEYNEITQGGWSLGLWVDRYTRPDGTVIGSDKELYALFNIPYDEESCPPLEVMDVVLTQEGGYDIGLEALAISAYLYVVAPGSAYSTTVLAQANGIECKLNACKVIAESTVSYQGKQIPLYTMLPGEEGDGNLYLYQKGGASYVVNQYTAKNDGGTLIDIADFETEDFIGRDNYYQYWWYGSIDNVRVYEFIEDGVVIQTIAVQENKTSAEPEKPSEPEKPEPETPVAPDAPGSYTVKPGDTWSTICTNFYGNNAQRYNLMKANNSIALKPGTVITLPEKLGNATLISAPEAGEGEVLYTVKAGDTLGKIAVAQYGNFNAYKDIFERNKDRLKNANTIYEGQIIVLPAK